MSIVGIDRIPLPYYKAKLRVEEALAASGLGHTIIRVTQFHDLIETMFSIQRFSPALFAIKGVRFQPIDTRDVATHLVSLIDNGPAGRVDDIGGPAVYDHDELGRMYLTSRSSRRRVLALPVPGADRRRSEVGSQPGAGKPGRDDRLRPAPGANSMSFLCLFAASS